MEFRSQDQPKRTYSGPKLSPYRKYKTQLRKDFNKRCGYTDCPDFWFGGVSTFHIDHFAPKSKFPELEEEYSNLVYSCSYVNRAKSDDWISNDKNIAIDNGKGYFDPCKEDYNNHFKRDSLGQIITKTDSPVAEYMHRKLKLYLKRYSIIWTLDQIRSRMDRLRDKIEHPTYSKDKQELKNAMSELAIEFLKYLDYLEAER
ncbi:MAG: hypothetical protein K9H49_01025 [Bacteroidales bacterium]|nr:hypothetical protein [Bacteroidales bacterium]MCF8403779.1 hypothetical protein [Bacteroidales bacterium]